MRDKIARYVWVFYDKNDINNISFEHYNQRKFWLSTIKFENNHETILVFFF